MRISDKNLYYVGGVVRDEILGARSFDTDYLYEGNAIEFAKKLGLNIIKENPAFGTVRALIDGEEVDIASTREENYPQKGKLPVVKNIGCKLKEDLKRRDFTINAMVKRTTDNEILDFYNSLDDIKNKKLRVLHNKSFIDDPTRILRALKFSIRFGFELEENTKKLQEEYLKNINYDMSFHRLRKELVETFDLNSQIAYEKFINENLYKLLSPNKQNLIKYDIQNSLKDFKTEHIWLIYLAQFDLSNIELTRKEKKILEWSKRLETEKSTNNTPKESLIIKNLNNF